MFVCGSASLQPARSVCVASEHFFIIIIKKTLICLPFGCELEPEIVVAHFIFSDFPLAVLVKLFNIRFLLPVISPFCSPCKDREMKGARER